MLPVNCRANDMSGHDVGSGPTIILLHSLLSDRGSLEPVVPLLQSNFRLVMLDLPGFGETAALAGGISDAAEQLAGAIDVLCGKERPLVFGNGYGSFIALALALRHPSAARGLMLAGCGVRFDDGGRSAFRAMAEKASAGSLDSIADVAMRRLFPPDMASRMPDIVAERRRSFLATNVAVFRSACEALANLDMSNEARELQIPLLASVGEFDEATPPIMAQDIARIVPRGTFRVIENCAHVPTLQAPGEVGRLLEEFAKQCSSL